MARREYIVFRSKYEKMGELENCLTYSPDTTLLRSNTGTYTYYHIGNKIWEVKDSDTLFEHREDGTWEKKYRECEYDIFSMMEIYPLYKKYSDDCQKFAKEEYVF